MDEIEKEEQVEESQSEEIILGTIDSITSEGVTLVIDGDDTAGQKAYKVNCSVRFVVGDRVKLTRNSGTYIVDFVVGNPMERFPIPAGGSDGQYLAKDGTNNYAVKWITPPIAHSIPSGGTSGQILAKSSNDDYAVSWINVPHELPIGGTKDQVLAKRTTTNYDVEWVTLESAHGIPSGGSTGQYLKKTSNTNYAVEWGNAPSVSALTSGNNTVTFSGSALYPSGTCSLGSSSYYFSGCYIDGSIRLGKNTYNSTLGFFGTTPQSQKRVGSSGTLAQLITALQGYGLIS